MTKVTALTVFGQKPIGTDIMILIDDPGGSPAGKRVTVQNLMRAAGTTYIDFLKISKPANPPTEEGRMYLKEIDADNNGLFIIIQKAGSLTEVQIG